MKPFGRGSYATTWGINSTGRGPVQSDSAPMKTKTYFAFRIDSPGTRDGVAGVFINDVVGDAHYAALGLRGGGDLISAGGSASSTASSLSKSTTVAEPFFLKSPGCCAAQM